MSIQAVSWAIKKKVGDPTLKILLIAICNYANQDCECWYSQAILARDSEVSTRTIRRALEKLRLMGLIETTERRRADGGNSTLLIRIIMDGPDKMAVGAQDTKSPSPPDTVVSAPLGHTLSAPNEPSFELSVEPSIERKIALRASSVYVDDWPDDPIGELWTAFPPGRKTGRGACERKLISLRKSGILFLKIIDGVRRYAASKPKPEYTKGPLVWLNQGCWDDEYHIATSGKAAAPSFFSEAMGVIGDGQR